jgi:hypothetical protein
MTEDNIPDELRQHLELIGARDPMFKPQEKPEVERDFTFKPQEKPEVERDFTFKMPNFDENGEPDF